MVDLLSATGRTGLHHSHHHIRLNREFREDLAWWCFLEQYNGVELIQGPKLDPGLAFTSDASGLWGCGASMEMNGFNIVGMPKHSPCT